MIDPTMLPDPFVWRCTKCAWTGPTNPSAAALHPSLGYAICPQCWRLGYYHDVERVPLAKIPPMGSLP